MLDLDSKTKKYIRTWLGFTLAMLFCMVLIGGVTRLTDSGLSMVEWKPLLGAIPPVSELEWQAVFEKYKQYPEYRIQNHRMSLDEFKFIFFWEYFHRLFGRMIGLVFFLPYIFFLVRKKLNKPWNKKLLLALLLGGSQGLLGWFMVKSGLVDRPDVSHFRLAAHFSLALGIIAYISWLIFSLKDKNEVTIVKEMSLAKRALFWLAPVFCAQVVFGAFVAGLDAGIGFNTFPKMGRHWIPNSLAKSDELLSMLINSNVGVQFAHRCFAWILTGFAVYFVYLALRKIQNTILKRDFLTIGVLIFAQFLLGVSTLLTKVDLVLASAHQMLACVLTVVIVKAFYDVIHIKVEEQETGKMASKTTA